MLKKIILIPASLFVLAILVTAGFTKSEQKNAVGVREPVVDGRFYPGEAPVLKKAIAGFFEDAAEPLGKKPLGIIAPHAGYIYSGQIAADAYIQASGHYYDLVVVLGTNHSGKRFEGMSLYPVGGYKTPLGVARIDVNLVNKLLDGSQVFVYNESAHKKEHSVEVQIPFIQYLFPDTPIIAAVVGAVSPKTCIRIGKKLARFLEKEGKTPLIVASSDLSHYPDYEDAKREDIKTLETIKKMDPKRLNDSLEKRGKNHVRNLSTFACGLAPIMTAQAAVSGLGANCARILSYANSGDVAIGNRSRVVGYAAMAFFNDQECKPVFFPPKKVSSAPGKNGFTAEQKKTLLDFARKTITRFADTRTAPLARHSDPSLKTKQGAFVTLKKNGHLRGCIGHMAQDTPLIQLIGGMALQAAYNDHRFPPLAREELDDINLEISVLTPFKKVGGPEDIVAGKDGVVLKKNGRSAVFLPQVATEQGWNREQMLRHLCKKAGLNQQAWKKGTDFYTFRATVFSESGLNKN